MSALSAFAIAGGMVVIGLVHAVACRAIGGTQHEAVTDYENHGAE